MEIMKKQAYNPYLSLYEYVPDGEPHVFDGRVYIYGSHDFAGGHKYCPGDYVTWSAPVDDLTDWRYEGVIYKREQDPSNEANTREMWAPDVAKGVDGRYYLYYCLAFLPEIGVAVSDSPTGPFAFYGHVKYPKEIMGGKELNEHLPFDPAVLVDDDGRAYLYYGFSPVKRMGPPPDSEAMAAIPEDVKAMLVMVNDHASPGGMVAELESDMLTLKYEPKICLPGGRIADGTGFEGHAFYEASSMRKVNGLYYYVYSSQLSHELCYAVSKYPDREFSFGGTIVSNADIGLNGRTEPLNIPGNNHGGLVHILDNWYVFYHRQTHGTESSRQGCAEKIQILPDGSIPQVEITSCGLNNAPLVGKGKYPAAIACWLTGADTMQKVNYGDERNEKLPYIFEEKIDADEKNNMQYVANVTDGVTIGFKYFQFENIRKIILTLRGEADGDVQLYIDSPDNKVTAAVPISLQCDDWTCFCADADIPDGVHGLFFVFRGTGALQFKDFELAAE